MRGTFDSHERASTLLTSNRPVDDWGKRLGDTAAVTMLTVELRDAEKASAGMALVEIFGDEEGLELLMRELEQLKRGATHVHLMTSAWAGSEVTTLKLLTVAGPARGRAALTSLNSQV